MARGRKAGPSTPAATAPKAGAGKSVAASAQDDTIFETSSKHKGILICEF
jgi:hypothetical protein